MSVFPMNAPHYAVYFMLDEPHGNKSTGGYSTAGAVSAPAAGRVIAKIAPMLGLLPDMAEMAADHPGAVDSDAAGRGYVSHWTGPLTFVPPSTPLPSAAPPPVARPSPPVTDGAPATHNGAPLPASHPGHGSHPPSARRMPCATRPA